MGGLEKDLPGENRCLNPFVTRKFLLITISHPGTGVFLGCGKGDGES